MCISVATPPENPSPEFNSMILTPPMVDFWGLLGRLQSRPGTQHTKSILATYHRATRSTPTHRNPIRILSTMPKKNTPVLTTAELEAAAKKSAEKNQKDIETADSYPLKFLQSIGGAEHFAAVVKSGDTRPFFTSWFMRRTCILPETYFKSLCPNPLFHKDCHLRSFVLDPDHLTSTHLELIGDGPLSVLKSLGTRQTLEMNEETGLPLMAKEGDSKNKRPQISTTKTPDFYTPSQTFMRYFPAFVAGDKDLNIGNTPVSIDDLTEPIGITDALFTKFLYGINPLEMPETGSENAVALWESSVKEKLFVVEVPNRLSPSYSVSYTISMPSVPSVTDTVECQGRRCVQQSDARLVKHWVYLTERLVGSDNVPDNARLYLADAALHGIDYDRVRLSHEAARVCSSTWQSLISAGNDGISANGRVTNEINADIAAKVSAAWAGQHFENPSIDVAGADGNVTTTLMFNSSEAERAMYGLYFTKAGYHDAADSYRSASYHLNLKMMNCVFKAVAYAILGKVPVHPIELFDTEATPTNGRTRKRKTTADVLDKSPTIAELFEYIKQSEKEHNEKMTAIQDQLDQYFTEHSKECRRARKFREQLCQRLPANEN